MASALSSVQDLEHIITSKIEEIGSTLGWAEYKASDAADTIETVQSYTAALVQESRKQTQRLRAISRKVEADDPVRREARQEIMKYLLEELKQKPDILAAALKGKPLSLSLTGDAVAELTEGELNDLLAEAVKALAAEKKSDS